jgi:tetratricopeptide (TPR) repeat protein
MVALSVLSKRTELEVEVALDEACRAEHLQLAPQGRLGGTYFRFHHALTQEALYATLETREPLRTRRLHRTIAEALERLPEAARLKRSGELAYHFRAAGETTEVRTKALTYALQAGDLAESQYAQAEAAVFYRSAAELAQRDEAPDPEREAEALEKLAKICAFQNHFEEAFASVNRSLELYRARCNVEALGRASALAGRINSLARRIVKGIDELQVAIDECRTPNACNGQQLSMQGMCALYSSLAQLQLANGNFAGQLAAAEQAVEAAEQAHDRFLLAQALLQRGSAWCTIGHMEQGIRDLEDALPVLNSQGAQWDLWFAYNILSYAHIFQGSWELGRQCSREGLAAAERLGDQSAIGMMTFRQGHCSFYEGNWAQARSFFVQAVRVAKQVEDTWLAAYPLLGEAVFALVTGERDKGYQLIEELKAKAAESHDQQIVRYAERWLAECDLIEERPDDVLTRLLPLVRQARGAALAVEALEFSPLVVLAYCEGGRLDDVTEEEAETLVVQCVTAARTMNMRPALVDALRAQGMLAMHRRQWQEAQESFDEAMSICNSIGSPYWLAKVYYSRGRLELAHGVPQMARDDLQTAHQLLAELGEALYAASIERILATIKD